MEQYHIFLGGAQTVALPWWWLDALIGWLGTMGVVLFLFGRPLVRPTFALLGLIVGAVVMAAVAQTVVQDRWPGSPTLPWVIGGAVAGGVALLLLYRVGMGIVFAIAVGIVAPLVLMLCLHIALPGLAEPIQTARTAIGENVQATTDLIENSERELTQEQYDQLTPITVPLQQLNVDLTNAWKAWWEGMTTGNQWAIGATCGGGAVVAGALGMALPAFASVLTTALLGTLMMLGGIYRVAGLMGEGVLEKMPATAASVAILIGSLTVIGSLIQWMLFRKKADK